MEKTYTEKDVIEAYKQGAKDYCKSPKGLQIFLRQEVKEFLNKLRK